MGRQTTLIHMISGNEDRVTLPFKSESFLTVVGVLALKPITVFESHSVLLELIVRVGKAV